MKTDPKQTSLRQILALSLGFAALFFVFKIVFFTWDAGHSRVLPSVLKGFAACPLIVVKLVFFFAVLFGLHALAAIAWYWLVTPLFQRLFKPNAAPQATVLGFIMCLFWLTAANSLFFPWSQFAFMVEPETRRFIVLYLFKVLSVALGLPAATGAVYRYALFARVRPRAAAALAAVLAAGAALAGAGAPSFNKKLSAAQNATREKPDILIIGIDSLRPDHAGYYNGLKPSLTPALDSLLARAAVFRNAWTVQARTFPAWLSILTGQYPVTHGGAFNLIDPAHVERADTLAHQLGSAGYLRLYAIDETRFSNMDTEYGFDIMLAPPIGAFDFLLETMADIPAVNLVANTAAGRLLFPQLHMNRAFPYLYKPELFDAALARTIRSLDRTRPLFLAAHFELPHWPYRWANSKFYQYAAPPDLEFVSSPDYCKAVFRADKQLAALLTALAAAGRLENAIMLVFSDHGEAFNPEEGLYTWRGDGLPKTKPPPHIGHGSSVLCETQNRIVLGFLGFGPQTERVVPGLNTNATVSLVDIRPTLEEWLGLSRTPDSVREGFSLYSAIKGENSTLPLKRIAYIESGFSLPSMYKGNPQMLDVLEEGLQFFTVMPNGRVCIDNEWLPFLLRHKQRAAISGRWAVGVFPGEFGLNNQRMFLVDFQNREFWNMDQPETLPNEAPALLLSTKILSRFYYQLNGH